MGSSVNICPVHVLGTGESVLPCVLSEMVLRGGDVPAGQRVCRVCLGLGVDVRLVAGVLGTGKSFLRYRYLRSRMSAVERVVSEDVWSELLGLRFPDAVPAWQVV